MSKQKITDEDALAFHLEPTPGKFEISATVPMTTQRDLSLAYSPGVAVPCEAIAKNPELAYDYTNKGNLVAPALAAGVQWRFTDDWTLRGEFNSFSNRTHMADISIAYWFGNSRYRPTATTQTITVAEITEEIVEDVVEEVLEPTLEDLEARNILALENDQLPAIYVDVDSTELNQLALNELEALVTALNAFPDVKIVIQGHTDNTGSKVYNQKLSERRAKRAYQYLVSQGIDKARLSSVGFGIEQPIADNNTEEGRRQNRRIDFIIETME